MVFKDRNEAALKLIPQLQKYKHENAVVIALPRGGVPIGYVISRNYNFPLDLIFAKKIGHPLNEEVAIGAVSIQNSIIDESFHIPGSFIQDEIKKIRVSLEERYKKLMDGRKPADLENKTVIIVDDGIATGNTILAAIKLVKLKKPNKIVIAVPVCPLDTMNKIKGLVDDFICLNVATNFYSVGQYYLGFSQVSDKKVSQLLNEGTYA